MANNKRRAGFVALSCVTVFSMANCIIYLPLALITGLDFFWFAGLLYFLVASAALFLGWKSNEAKKVPTYIGAFVMGVVFTVMAFALIFSTGFLLIGILTFLLGIYGLFTSWTSYKKSRLIP